MNHTDLLKRLVSDNKAKAYLEIGVGRGSCFREIDCEIKVGVDPRPGSSVTHQCTSDEFFQKNRRKFDVIFIDGDHTEAQVTRDLENALKYLKKGGFIVVHDVFPRNARMQMVPRQTIEWTGDVWKAWVRFVHKHEMCVTMRDDYGIGVYNVSLPEMATPIVPDTLNYEWYTKNRGIAMNVIDGDELWELLEYSTE